MGSNDDTVYVKLPQNVRVFDKNVKLSDVAKIQCANEGMLRRIKQKKLYTFANPTEKMIRKKQVLNEVFSILKVVELIQEEYPQADVQNLGEKDFIVEFLPGGEPGKVVEVLKTIAVTIIIFFGAAFSIMAFNNDISVTDLFDKLYYQVMGQTSEGVTILEISYCIGLGIGILVFFNHTGKKKIVPDPTPVQVEMRKYEKDIDTTYIENAGRGGKSVDVQ